MEARKLVAPVCLPAWRGQHDHMHGFAGAAGFRDHVDGVAGDDEGIGVGEHAEIGIISASVRDEGWLAFERLFQ